MNTKRSCESCIWYGQCGDKTPCEDYTSWDDDPLAFTYYESILTENAAEYAGFVAEMEA